MEAKLVYSVEGENFVLYENSLEKIDKFTSEKFHEASDIFSYQPYQEKLDKLPKNGRFFISYSNADVPMESIDFYVALGKNPFDSEQTLGILVGEDGVSITENGLIEFARKKLDTILKVTKLKEDCIDCFKSEELLMFDFAQNCNYYKFCLETLESVLDRECGNNDDGYFFRRLVVDKVKFISGKQNSFDNKKI